MDETDESVRVRAALMQFHAEVRALQEAGDEFRHCHARNLELLVDRLARLKHRLKDAARYETLDGTKRAKTEMEQAFYGPAVRQAAAHFRMRVDAPPARWRAGLSDTECDLSYMLHQLDNYLRDRAAVE